MTINSLSWKNRITDVVFFIDWVSSYQIVNPYNKIIFCFFFMFSYNNRIHFNTNKYACPRMFNNTLEGMCTKKLFLTFK